MRVRKPEGSVLNGFLSGYAGLISVPRENAECRVRNAGSGTGNSFTFSLIKHNPQYVVVVRQLFLCLLASMTLGMLTMAVHMLWKNGPGILVGAVALACDYLVTVVLDMMMGLRYLSPLTLSRIAALSTSANDRTNPSFLYACLFLGGLFLVSLFLSIWKLRRYEYGR